MSSFVRRIARAVLPSQKIHPVLDDEMKPVVPAQYYANGPAGSGNPGWGTKLGVTNPEGRELVARLRRDRKWGRAA